MKNIIKYIRICVGISLIFIGTLLIFIENKIKKTKNSPCKRNKDKSIIIFVQHFNENLQRDCRAIAKGTINLRGEVYVFPDSKNQKEFPFHESFHKVGRFHKSERHHWKQGNKYLYPLAFNGEGLPVSHKFVNFAANRPYCFCFSKGRRVKDEEIRPLVEKLIRYVPSVNIEEVVLALKKRSIFQARRQFSVRDF